MIGALGYTRKRKDREKREEGLNDVSAALVMTTLAPDGTHIALSTRNNDRSRVDNDSIIIAAGQ